jgi:hypothetical protein
MSRLSRYFFYCFVFIVIFAASSVYLGGLLGPKDLVITPQIDPVAQPLPQLVANHSFPFEGATVEVTIPINNSVYQGALQADQEITVYGNVSENTWIADSYRAMITDPAQDDFYRDLTGEFNKIRVRNDLSDDEYLELMAVYVQSLQYEADTDNPAKYPIETAMDGAGDCEDKSLLLAGLLSHEGYQVALFSFGPEDHMAVGVGSDSYLYKNTGYAFVETTVYSYVGVPTTTLAGGVVLRSDPVVIPIGNGTKVYTSGNETSYLEDIVVLTQNRIEEMEPQLNASAQDLDAKQARISSLEAQMVLMKSRGDLQGYNSQVSAHNALVTDYNTELGGYRRTLALYQNYVQIHNYIVLNAFDRTGVYQYVKQNPVT